MADTGFSNGIAWHGSLPRTALW